MIRFVLPLLVLLAACGVDGAPVPPSQVEDDRREIPAPRNQVTISGSLGVGVGGSL